MTPRDIGRQASNGKCERMECSGGLHPLFGSFGSVGSLLRVLLLLLTVLLESSELETPQATQDL